MLVKMSSDWSDFGFCVFPQVIPIICLNNPKLVNTRLFVRDSLIIQFILTSEKPVLENNAIIVIMQ